MMKSTNRSLPCRLDLANWIKAIWIVLYELSIFLFMDSCQIILKRLWGQDFLGRLNFGVVLRRLFT